MAVRQVMIAVLMILLATFLYDRSGILKTFYLNAPQRFQPVQAAGLVFDIEHVTQVRNCEDIFLHEKEEWAIVSCDPGRDIWNTVMGTFIDPVPSSSRNEASNDAAETGLYMYRYAASDEHKLTKLKLLDFRPDPADFHPLGIEYEAESRKLYVVNHAYSGSSIEIFTLLPEESAATHIRTIKHSLLSTPNAIQALSATEFLVTNDHFFQRRYHPTLAKLETFTSIPGGTVTHVRLNDKFELVNASTVSRVPFANGIALLNTTSLAVASSSAGSVRMFDLKHGSDGQLVLKYKSSIVPPFIPDNISVDSKGVLLIAGHPHVPSLEKVATNARLCSPVARQQNETLNKWCEETLRPYYLSWVAEWTAEAGLTTIFAGQGSFGSSTTAVRDNNHGIGIVTGLYERGLLHFSKKAK